MSENGQLESPNVASGTIVWIIAGFCLFLALTIGGVRLFSGLTVTRPTSPAPNAFAKPRLETDNGADELAQLQAEQTARLTGYAWIDRDHGVARIPITRAMAQIVMRGQQGYAPVDAHGDAHGDAGKAPTP
jgi:hypothetical protein